MSDKKLVLIVDDNLDILDLLELFLYEDFDIITAVNGFDGLNMTKEQTPDCIVTDIMMPVMDGIRFFNSLRKEEATRKTPIIGVTSFVKKTTVKSLMNMGFQTVVEKPLNREAILGAVRKAMELPQQQK